MEYGMNAAIFSPSPRGSETILLVEDAQGVRALLGRVLRAQGYTVLEASHGREALSICEQHTGPIHLLVSDLVMPLMGGPALADRLKFLYPSVSVLFISGYSDDKVGRQQLLETQAAFLEKPFTPETLVRKVRALLDKKTVPSEGACLAEAIGR